MGGDVNRRGRARRSGFLVLFAVCAVPALMMASGALQPAGAQQHAGAAERPRFFSLSFDSEWIRLAVIGDSLEVRGTYFLSCGERTNASAWLFYPFPEDSLLGGARIVSMTASVDGVDAGDVEWIKSRGPSGVRFRTPPCTGDTIAIDAVYRQELAARYARYIVTSTRAWHRPLRLARFEIRLPPGAVPTEFSFPFQPRDDSLGNRYYGFETRDFLPDRDVVVRWREADAK